MFKNFWLIAIRRLWKHKVHTFINILGLTIGLASCLIIFLITHFELGYDRFHPNGDRIYRVVTASKFNDGVPGAEGSHHEPSKEFEDGLNCI